MNDELPEPLTWLLDAAATLAGAVAAIDEHRAVDIPALRGLLAPATTARRRIRKSVTFAMHDAATKLALLADVDPDADLVDADIREAFEDLCFDVAATAKTTIQQFDAFRPVDQCRGILASSLRQAMQLASWFDTAPTLAKAFKEAKTVRRITLQELERGRRDEYTAISAAPTPPTAAENAATLDRQRRKDGAISPEESYRRVRQRNDKQRHRERLVERKRQEQEERSRQWSEWIDRQQAEQFQRQQEAELYHGLRADLGGDDSAEFRRELRRQMKRLLKKRVRKALDAQESEFRDRVAFYANLSDIVRGLRGGESH